MCLVHALFMYKVYHTHALQIKQSDGRATVGDYTIVMTAYTLCHISDFFKITILCKYYMKHNLYFIL